MKNIDINIDISIKIHRKLLSIHDKGDAFVFLCQVSGSAFTISFLVIDRTWKVLIKYQKLV